MEASKKLEIGTFLRYTKLFGFFCFDTNHAWLIYEEKHSQTLDSITNGLGNLLQLEGFLQKCVLNCKSWNYYLGN